MEFIGVIELNIAVALVVMACFKKIEQKLGGLGNRCSGEAG
jgi:hypothetical protein